MPKRGAFVKAAVCPVHGLGRVVGSVSSEFMDLRINLTLIEVLYMIGSN